MIYWDATCCKSFGLWTVASVRRSDTAVLYLSSSIRVSFESRYGMCCLPRWSVRAEMTFPRAESDWLIFLLSCKRWPVAPDSRTRSDPARSTKLSFPTYNGSTKR